MNRIQAGKVAARVFSQRHEVQCLENGSRGTFAKNRGCLRAWEGINRRKQESRGGGRRQGPGPYGFCRLYQVLWTLS